MHKHTHNSSNQDSNIALTSSRLIDLWVVAFANELHRNATEFSHNLRNKNRSKPKEQWAVKTKPRKPKPVVFRQKEDVVYTSNIDGRQEAQMLLVLVVQNEKHSADLRATTHCTTTNGLDETAASTSFFL